MERCFLSPIWFSVQFGKQNVGYGNWEHDLQTIGKTSVFLGDCTHQYVIVAVKHLGIATRSKNATMGAAAPFKLHLGNWRLDLHLFLQAAYCFVVVLVLVQNETCWKHPVNQRSVLRSFHQCSKTVPWLKSIAFCSCRESCSHECHVNTVRSVLAPSSDARSP